MSSDLTFHWADYLVFALTIGLSCGIGLFFGFTGKRQSTTEEFLMAGRNMKILPVSVSIFVSWMSAISFLGDPVEVYYYGGIYWILAVGYILALPVVAHIFAPYYHQMQLTSVYEFLETRYNKSIRVLGSINSAIVIVIWLAIVLYAPSIALSQVSGLRVEIAIVVIGIACTFYTTFGGMKAVLWADTLQMFIMFAGVVAIVVQGTIKVGGVGKVWELNEKGGRFNFNNYSPNPHVRASFWTFLVGGFFRVYGPYVGSQMCVQRYCTLKTARQAKLAIYLNTPLYAIMVSLLCLMGLVMYALYSGCDPLLAGKITRPDQMVPLLVLEVLGFLPGLPGLFMACVFSASLSTISSGLNGLAATTLKDIVVPLYKKMTGEGMVDSKQTLTAKIIAVVFGVLTIALAFLILNLSSSIFEMTAKIGGMFGGPLAGIFTLAVLCPSLGPTTAVTSYVVSSAVSIWWGVGAQLHGVKYPILPISAADCPILPSNGTFDLDLNSTLAILSEESNYVTSASNLMNITTDLISSNSTEIIHSFDVTSLYRLTPLLYMPFGCTFTILLGLIIHCITLCIGKIMGKDYKSVPKEDINDNTTQLPHSYDKPYESNDDHTTKQGTEIPLQQRMGTPPQEDYRIRGQIAEKGQIDMTPYYHSNKRKYIKDPRNPDF